MDTLVIADIEQKYAQLSEAQKEMFAGYGLRQIKHFVDPILKRPYLKAPSFKGLMPMEKFRPLMRRLGNTIYGFLICNGNCRIVRPRQSI